MILKKGDKSDRAYVILEGSASAYVHIGANDIKERFATLNTGSCFNVFHFLNPDSA